MTASDDVVTYGRFGYSVAISENTVVVGIPFDGKGSANALGGPMTITVHHQFASRQFN